MDACTPEQLEQDSDATAESFTFFVLEAESTDDAGEPRESRHDADELCRAMGPLAAVLVDGNGRARVVRRDDPSRPFDPRELLDERVAAAVPLPAPPAGESA